MPVWTGARAFQPTFSLPLMAAAFEGSGHGMRRLGKLANLLSGIGGAHHDHAGE
jgi:hypothetical protein